MANEGEERVGFSSKVLSDERHRAEKKHRLIDSDELINVAVKYFKNRCAFSGEEFVTNEAGKTNMSLEHVVALDAGGHHIAPNIVPTVLQYNIRKNNSNLLDYWEHEKDKNGKSIYNPYKLLNLVNYMLRSIKAKNDSLEGEQYEKAVLRQNDEDDVVFTLLEKAERDGMLSSDNKTDITDKLGSINTKRRNIKKDLINPINNSHKLKKWRIKRCNAKKYKSKKLIWLYKDNSRIVIFLCDAINKLEQELKIELGQEKYDAIMTQLKNMYAEVKNPFLQDIDIQISIRDIVIEQLKKHGIEYVYTVTDEVLRAQMAMIKKVDNKANEEVFLSNIQKPLAEKIETLSQLYPEKAKDYITKYPRILYDDNVLKRLKKYKDFNLDVDKNIDVQNIDFAMMIVEKFEFNKKQLDEKRQRELLPKILNNAVLNESSGSYLSTLYSNLLERGLNEQEAYGAIINYAIGEGKQGYTAVLLSKNKIPEKAEEIKTTVDEEDKTTEELKKELCGITGEENPENIKTDAKNIRFALKMMKEFKLNGDIISKERQRELLPKILNNVLNESRGSYLSTLYSNLLERGLNEQEAYGAIINYAIGEGKQGYTAVLFSKNKIPEKKEIKTEVTEEALERFMKKQTKEEDIKTTEELKKELCGIIEEENPENIKTSAKNIRFALKMMKEFRLNGDIISKERQRELLPKILNNAFLNEGRSVYLSTLYSNLLERGLNEQEAYGAIINYTIGEGNQVYSKVLNSKNKIPEKKEIKTAVDEEDIKTTEELKKELCEITGEENPENIKTSAKNIRFALKMMKEFRLNGDIISKERQQELLSKILNTTHLNEGNGTLYLSTLYGNLQEKGLSEQEAYGAIINYAIGEGKQGYTAVLFSKNKIPEKKEIKTTVDEEDIKTTEELKKELCGITGEENPNNIKTDAKNIRFALKMMKEFRLNGDIISKERQRELLPKILNNVLLNEGSSRYLSTLYSNLLEIGLNEQEAYGAIINYAIGEGNQVYSDVIKSKNKIPEKAEEINTKVIEEALERFMEKQKAKKKVRGAVSAVTVEKLGKIGQMIAEAIKENELDEYKGELS